MHRLYKPLPGDPLTLARVEMEHRSADSFRARPERFAKARVYLLETQSYTCFTETQKLVPI
jgi:hypothetical protein